MALTFEKAVYTDKDWLTKVMTAAFNYDTALHREDIAEDGPPGYNDGRLAEKMLTTDSLITYIVVVAQERIGFLSFSVEGMTGTLEKLCLLPVYIGKGFGKQAWALLEKQHEYTKWIVETPDYSVSNRRFYEKCGFVQTGKKYYGEDSYSVVLEKHYE